MRTSLAVCLAVVLELGFGGCGPAPERDDAQTQPVVAVGPPEAPDKVLRLPKRPGSFRFAAIGDAGRGDGPQYEVAARMEAFREVFPFTFVIMLGDNVYDGGRPEDYKTKFERPYESLLDDKVRFYAVIGNHDAANQPTYPLFHMGGERYYTFTPEPPLLAGLMQTSVQFFMIDTEYVDDTQLAWLDREMGRSTARWKIPVFHRPIYTSGRYGSPARIFRGALEPIFLRHGVRVGFSGHEHFYERILPQHGITYFISGAAGSLRPEDLGRSSLTARGYDDDYSFMLIEVTGDELHFQSISRAGHSVDAGVITADTDPRR
jgi:hypothetical protein